MFTQQTPSRSFFKPTLIIAGFLVSVVLILFLAHITGAYRFTDHLMTWRLSTRLQGYRFDKLYYEKGVIHIQGLRIPSQEGFSIQSLTIPCHYKDLWAGRCRKITARGLSFSVNVGSDASLNFGHLDPNLHTFDEWEVQESTINLVSPWGYYVLNFSLQTQQTTDVFSCTFQTTGPIESTGSFHKNPQMTMIIANIHKAAPFKLPLHLTLITREESPTLAVDLEIQEMSTQQKILKAQGSFQPTDKKGNITIEGHAFPLSHLLDLSPFLAYENNFLTSLDGNIDLKGTLTWDGSWTSAQGPIMIHCNQGNLITSHGKVHNFSGTLHFSHLNPFVISQPQEIRAEQISLESLNVALAHAKMIFTFSPQGEFTPTLFSAQTLGGEMTAHNFRSFKDWRDGSFCEVDFHNIHLEDLITVLAIKDLKINATVQGRARLALKNEKLELQNLEFYSTTPKGQLQYFSTLSSNNRPTVQGDQLAFEVLRDLHFTRLEGKIYQNPQSREEFKAEVKLAGFNPEVLQGYPFEFNLTATGALKELIQNTLRNLQPPKELKDISRFAPKPENRDH